MTPSGETLDLSRVFDDYPHPFYVIRPILELDGSAEDFEYKYVNHAFCAMVGRSMDQLLGHCFRENFGKGERVWLDLFVEAAVDKRNLCLEESCVILGKRMYTEAFPIYPDLCGCMVYSVKNEPEKIAAARDAEMHHRANFDFLTGFYNRYYLQEHSRNLAALGPLGIAYMDVNDLKYTNDVMGHQAGDRRIIQAASRLRDAFPGGRCFRMGGDEFAVISAGLTEAQFQRQVQAALAAFEADQLAALGCAYFPDPQDILVCLDHCDKLMYAQKNKNRQRILQARKLPEGGQGPGSGTGQ
jgi:diguanylate cyclase (GGDEF)-like protein